MQNINSTNNFTIETNQQFLRIISMIRTPNTREVVSDDFKKC